MQWESKNRCVIHSIRGGILRWKGNAYLVILDTTNCDYEYFVCFRYSSNLLLTAKDKAVYRASCLTSALTQCIYDIQNATNHDMVTMAVHRLHTYVTIGQKDSIVDKLLESDWMDALHR